MAKVMGHIPRKVPLMKDDPDYGCILNRAIFGIKNLNGPKDHKNVCQREKRQVRFFYKHTNLKKLYLHFFLMHKIVTITMKCPYSVNVLL